MKQTGCSVCMNDNSLFFRQFLTRICYSIDQAVSQSFAKLDYTVCPKIYFAKLLELYIASNMKYMIKY